MHDALVDATGALGIELPNIDQAATRTAERLEACRTAAQDHVTNLDVGVDGVDLDIVAYGSMARGEMHADSDFDWLIVAHKYVEEPVAFETFKEAAEAARRRLGAAKPGPSGIFGTVVGGTELVDKIGLEDDTNLTQTRRVLTVEESVSLLAPDRHEALLKAISSRYLHDQQKADGVPRFLLNDVIRYWRTITVDYQAKRWRELEAKKWAMRLLKLRSSRKWTYAGTLASLFLPVVRGEPVTPDWLTRQWMTPPLARLAQLIGISEHTDAALSTALGLADGLLGRLSTSALHDEATQVTHPREAEPGTVLAEAHRQTQEFNQAIATVFLGPPGAQPDDLNKLCRTYLVS